MLYNNMEESQMPWTKFKKSGTKNYKMHGSFDTKFEKWQNHKDRNQISDSERLELGKKLYTKWCEEHIGMPEIYVWILWLLSNCVCLSKFIKLDIWNGWILHQKLYFKIKDMTTKDKGW